MKVEQLTCALGAQISDLNLAEAGTNDDLAGELGALLLQHKVLFFRDQTISDAQHAAVARRFGDLEDHPLAASDDSEPGIIHIWKSPESPPERYENSWHTDATWRECPPMGAILHCVECPPVGGDTMWANMELAYARLPDRIKQDIADLRARHSMEASFMAAKPMADRLAMKERFPDPEHPVVRTHPVTGNKSLFVNAFATHFTNYHTADRVRFGQDFSDGSGALLRYLVSQAHVPEYQVRWRWTPGSVVLWDNRCTQHYAVMDYPPCVRRMNRATIIGDRPF
ncbi:MAG: TauD/TfdA family dioxygenase [Novosphingobium sp.]|uniref:TauD/TfdA dioxygenase family protein n=1 Tax=Novosphingobium sp. TaxID=1874826 RepID=UPI0032BB2371